MNNWLHHVCRVSSLWKNHGNLENEKNFFQTWKNYGIWKKPASPAFQVSYTVHTFVHFIVVHWFFPNLFLSYILWLISAWINVMLYKSFRIHIFSVLVSWENGNISGKIMEFWFQNSAGNPVNGSSFMLYQMSISLRR